MDETLQKSSVVMLTRDELEREQKAAWSKKRCTTSM